MIFARRPAAQQPIVARVRVDRRTKRLVNRLDPGDIAVIDHHDLDRVAAEALLRAKPSAVLNASASVTGRYPSAGASILVSGGITLIDNLGETLMTLTEGSTVDIDGGSVFSNGELVATGVRQSMASVAESIEKAREGLSIELQAFAENTLKYISEESHLLFDPPDPPTLRTDMRGRHVMVVVRGHHFREDIDHLRSYVRDMRPVIIAVDGGADVCLEANLKPDILIGDFDSVTDDAIRCGAELVVHAYVGGRAPGAERLDKLDVPYITYEAPGMSEDVAMLLAYDEGAELIVAVGTHASMEEFLDKGRAGMASTFLTRLKVGPRLVDAKGVSRLYQGTIRKSDLTFLIASAFVAFVVMATVSSSLTTFLSVAWFLLTQSLNDVFTTLTPW